MVGIVVVSRVKSIVIPLLMALCWLQVHTCEQSAFGLGTWSNRCATVVEVKLLQKIEILYLVRKKGVNMQVNQFYNFISLNSECIRVKLSVLRSP